MLYKKTSILYIEDLLLARIQALKPYYSLYLPLVITVFHAAREFYRDIDPH